MNFHLHFFLFVLLMVFMHRCDGNCNTSHWSFNVTTWSGEWEFTGFEIGPSSGDYYHLLSTSAQNQCAIVRETTAGNITWAKVYSTDQCAGISIDSTETDLYFINKGASYLGINQINCSDGESRGYKTSTTYSTSAGVNTIDASTISGFLFFGGNINSSSSEDCGFFWELSQSSFSSFCSSAFKISAFVGNLNTFCAFREQLSDNQLQYVCGSTTNGATDAFTQITLSDTNDVPSSTKADVGTSNIYVAYDTASSSGIFLTGFARGSGGVTTGTNNLKKRTSTQQLKVGSVYAIGNRIAYVSLYSSSTSYAELIRMDHTDLNYTIYQQTGLDLRIQFLNTALSDCWYSLRQTQYIGRSQISTMNDLSDLSVVELTNSGLDDYTVTVISTFGSFSPSLANVTFDTSTTNAASDFSVTIIEAFDTVSTNTSNTNQTTNENNTNNSDDSISTLAIVLISIGGVLVLIAIIGIALVTIHCCKKSKLRKANNKPAENNVEVSPEESKNLNEENKI